MIEVPRRYGDIITADRGDLPNPAEVAVAAEQAASARAVGIVKPPTFRFSDQPTRTLTSGGLGWYTGNQ
jgi:hypothetical protein